nr:hypothetical protein [Tanacetum cinerariifolium]
MDSDQYLEGKSMQRPPLSESDHFIYWKNRSETHVKAKDLDLWHIILNGDFPPVAKNEVTKKFKVVPFEEQSDDLKQKLAKNNESKMVLYNALPKKEYKRILCVKQLKIFGNQKSINSGFAIFNTIITSLKALDEESKDLSSLDLDELIGNLKVHEVGMEKDSEIYSGFAIFNTIITSLKALNEGFSRKNNVRKFLRALHPKWRAKAWKKILKSIEAKKERIKFIVLKAKKESSDDEISTSGSDDEVYDMAVKNFKKFSRRNGKFVRQPREEKKSFQQRDEKKGKSGRKYFRCGDPNHLIGDCPKLPRNKDQKASLEVLGEIAKMTPKTTLKMKLVS